ncbi:MAG: hypothetical protein CFH43_01120 [Proteobacteria bacterium]|nr:MAG: hypothetical protein CFH43_01120 [Pseudomonadota bacterium]
MPVGGSIFLLMILLAVTTIGLMLSFSGATPGGEQLTVKTRCLALVVAVIAFVVFIFMPDLGVFS